MKKLFALVAIILAASFGQTAQAHVMVTDDTKTKGAILHINPDDNPIAGQPSTLFFDMQSASLDRNVVVKLTIDGEGKRHEVKAKTNGTLATFTHTFPTQGVYTLTFLATTDNQKYTFTQTWRVSRGTATSAINMPHHAWAQVVLIGSGVGLAVLVVIMLGRWRDIWHQSTF